jgi:isopentenyl-diphosphate delta-isomerase
MKKNNEEIWLQRKLDHLKNSIEENDGPGTSGFEDIHLVHQALPGLSWHEINTETVLFGKKINMPLIINALTGGPPQTLEINKSIAEAAERTKIGMALGSQSLAIKRPHLDDSFKIVRKVNPDGLIIANVSGNVKPKAALEAVEMLQADALQLHLNPAQELFMDEGDRDFKNIRENIIRIIDDCPVEVIVKEVGFGISFETARILSDIGIKWIDIGGSGGTNFINIETMRSDKKYSEPPLQWGIPTAASILEIMSLKKDINIIAGGGIRNSLDMVKCFALGVKAVAVAGPILKLAVNEGVDGVIKYINHHQQDVRKILLLSGVKIPYDMKNRDVIITGKLREWQIQRKI